MSLDEGLVRQTVLEAKGQGKWMRACCPWCLEKFGTADRRFSWGVNRLTGEFHCFRCHIRGKVDLSTLELRSSQIATATSKRFDVYPDRLPESYMPLFDFDTIDSIVYKEAHAYLCDRGIDSVIAKKLRLGACLSGFARGRIIVPIYRHSDLVGWLGRLWVDDYDNRISKYIYPPGFDRENIMYNMEALEVETTKPVLLVEGAFDAIAHYPNAVAFLGKPTSQHINIVSNICRCSGRPVMVVLDGDSPKESEALVMRLIMEGVDADGCILEAGDDPASTNSDNLWRSILG